MASFLAFSVALLASQLLLIAADDSGQYYCWLSSGMCGWCLGSACPTGVTMYATRQDCQNSRTCLYDQPPTVYPYGQAPPGGKWYCFPSTGTCGWCVGRSCPEATTMYDSLASCQAASNCPNERTPAEISTSSNSTVTVDMTEKWYCWSGAGGMCGWCQGNRCPTNGTTLYDSRQACQDSRTCPGDMPNPLDSTPQKWYCWSDGRCGWCQGTKCPSDTIFYDTFDACQTSTHCGVPTGSSCVDKFPDCGLWMGNGECQSNTVWMNTNCPVACNQCA